MERAMVRAKEVEEGEEDSPRKEGERESYSLEEEAGCTKLPVYSKEGKGILRENSCTVLSGIVENGC